MIEGKSKSSSASNFVVYVALAQTTPAAYAASMCSAVGNLAAPGDWTVGGAASIGNRLRARFQRAQILQHVLSTYGLKAYDGGLVPGGKVVDPLAPCLVG